MIVKTWHYLPFYFLGIFIAVLDHVTAIVLTITWGLTTILLNGYINYSQKTSKKSEDLK